MIQTTTLTNVSQLQCEVVDAKRCTSVRTLKRTLARVQAVISGTKKSLTRIFENPPKESIEKAWTLLLQCEQKVLQDDYQKGKFCNLGAAKNKNGIVAAGARVGAAVPLLRQSSLSDFLVRDAHNQGHLGVAATTSKMRATAWVVNLPKFSKKVVRGCYGCRRDNKEAMQEFLGSPADERLKPSLPFTNVCLDLFGPINVRLTMSKTDIGKAYGVITTCMFTRAIHLDVAAEYST